MNKHSLIRDTIENAENTWNSAGLPGPPSSIRGSILESIHNSEFHEDGLAIRENSLSMTVAWWSGRDCKMITRRHRALYQETTFWDAYHPYMNNITTIHNWNEKTEWIDYRGLDHVFYLIHGNPGYGHFLCDTLPRLLGCLSAHGTKDDAHIITHSLDEYQKRIIKSFASYIGVEIKLHELKPSGDKIQIVLCESAFRPPVRPAFWRVEYMQRFLSTIKNTDIRPSTGNTDLLLNEHIALVRSPHRGTTYKSRIVNNHAVTNILRKRGFRLIQPEKLDFFSLLHILSNARVVFSEPGSILLNACTMCSLNTHIISPISTSALVEPSLDIVWGGWHYNLGRRSIKYIPSLTLKNFEKKEFASLIEVDLEDLQKTLDATSS